MKVTNKEKAVIANSVLVDNYQTRLAPLQGRDHLVVPVIMMVEGVHNGSRGPMLYTAEDLGQFVESWDGIPVVVNHPNEGQSANDPELSGQIVGRIHNTHMEGDKLKAEAWIDVDNLKGVSSDTLDHIQEQRPLDVSVGVYSEEDETEGDWNGEHYRAIARNYRPDHLALLPNASGACSWDDGCGIRNSKIENKLKTKQGGGLMDENKKVKKENPRLDEMFVNETGYREIGMLIQSKLDAMDSNSKYHYLEEIYSDTFVYRVSNSDTRTSTYYKQSYSVDDSDQVVLIDGITEVRRNVSFDEVQNVNSGLTRNKFSNKTKSKMTRKEKVSPCKIDALISNEATKFTEDDREWLGTLEDDVLDKLAPIDHKPLPIVKEKEAVVNTKPEVTEEAVKSILSKNKELIYKLMPDDVKDQIQSGLKMYKEKRAGLIEAIVANSKFTEENLKEWKTEDLENLHESVVPEVEDYSARATKAVVNSDRGDLEIMLNLKTEETK